MNALDEMAARLEETLQRLPHIQAVRVVTSDTRITEIHVIATTDKDPRTVVRDVETVAAAGFGIGFDHRIVSVVCFDDLLQRSPQLDLFREGA